MRPKQLVEYLKAVIPARLITLITGPPGVGKTSIAEQVAFELGYDHIVCHPVYDDPTDAKGIPWVDAKKGTAEYFAAGVLSRILNTKKDTLVTIDDFGQASPAVQAAYMPILLDRAVNGHKIPDCVALAATTNRRTDKAGVSGLLEPVKSRFSGGIVNLEVNEDDICEWFMDRGYPFELTAFLRFRPALIHSFQATNDLTNSPCPRTWAYVGKAIGLKMSPELELAAIKGLVGEGAAGEFVAFLRVARELPSLDGILIDPDGAIVPKTAAARYAVAIGLASKVTPANFARAARYAERLMNEASTEFAVVMVHAAMKRDPSICDTQAFIRMATGELGAMVSGR